MAPKPPGMQVSVRIDGAAAILASFSKMGDSKAIGNDYLRIGSADIAQDMVGWTQAAARGQGRQAAKFAPFIKAKQDRVPVVIVSPTGSIWQGSKLAGSKKSYQALAGSEFGANKGSNKFSPHGFEGYIPSSSGRGGEGYWFFPTARAHQAEISTRWTEVANAIVEAYGNGTL